MVEITSEEPNKVKIMKRTEDHFRDLWDNVKHTNIQIIGVPEEEGKKHTETTWRRKWQPAPVFLPGKSHGWRSLVGYCPWGRKESDTTERLHYLSMFPGSSAGKESACNTGGPGSIPGTGRSAGEEIGYPLQYSGLENFMSSPQIPLNMDSPTPSPEN